MATACKQPEFIKIPCYLTGRLVLDTDRERIRQKLAKFLVDERGYRIDDFILDREIVLEIDAKKVIALIDLTVRINARSLMILRGGPGSVVTRESGTIAAARLIEPDYIVPWAVQANLFDAALLDVRLKKAVGYGWDIIPTRQRLLEMTSDWPPPSLPEKRIPIERQILYSYDSHG
ncbi:MAG: type I restriction enzyme HsdR N-terminal domain-containing protein [Dissulfurimicrobium sp.]|uniref:type I restriction enzyme HsdR N-terminal domain-containing protein n=1 Tax=Dissulfurimicrobium sp. TaxID=2022436 RepID=UPI00404A9011